MLSLSPTNRQTNDDGSQIDLQEIMHWLHSTQSSLSHAVKLSEVKHRVEYVPAAYADFDGLETMGRISGWITGQFDFEVIRTADGRQTFFQHHKVKRIDDPALNAALSDFVAALDRTAQE